MHTHLIRTHSNSGWGYEPLLETVALEPLLSIYCAKASHVQPPDIPLRSDTQALRLIASIPLIQQSRKCHSCEEKSTFP